MELIRQDERELEELLTYLPAVPPAWRDAAHAIPRLAREEKHSFTAATRAATDEPNGEDLVRTPR